MASRSIERPPAHVQVAIGEPGLLAHLAVALDREGQHFGRRQDLEAVHVDLDLAGGQLGVDGVGRPGHHLAGDGDHALEAQSGERLEGGVPGMGDELHHPRAVVAPEEGAAGRGQVGVRPCRVAQVYEEQATVVPLGRHPARQAHSRADVGGAQGAAAGAAVQVGRQSGGLGGVGHVGPRLSSAERLP